MSETPDRRIVKISEILKSRLSSIYCDSCAHETGDDRCDMCHRKSMNWRISEVAADRLAINIIEALEDMGAEANG